MPEPAQIVLGCCRPADGSPDGFSILKRGALGAVAINRANAPTPKDRLRLCLRVHAVQPSFLPIGPKLEMPSPEAARLMERNTRALETALDRVAGRTEAVIDLKMGAASKSPVGSGRAWLRQRHEAWAVFTRLQDVLQGLSRDLGLEHIALRQGRGAALLVEPACLRDLQATLKSRLASMPIGRGELLVTAPWPPFHFAQLEEIR